MDKQKKIKLEILAEIKALKGANEILKNQKEFTQANKLNFDSFHLFFMKSSLPMWVYGKHTYLVLDVNKAACKIYDYSREEFLKMSILDFRPKKDKERLLANLKKPRPERFFSKGCRHQFKNGQVIDVEVSSQELNYEGKEAVMVVAHDIKSKVEPKNMVKQSEEKFRLITTHAKDAIILMDEKDCVTLWNPAAEKIFGFTQEEVIGKNLRSFIMPQRYSEQMKKGFIHFIKSGQGPLIGNLIEIEALHKSGHEFPISMSVAAFKLNNKWNAAATVRDITEQKTAPQKLLQSEEKEKRVDELTLANKALTFQNEEKEKRVDELTLANTELAFQNKEKEKRADELALANTEIAFQNEEKEKRADELALANTELAFQNEEKEKRADELILANKELAFQNKEKQKRADELALANTELAFQNEEKQKRADELALANTELAFQNEEKQKRADELTLANTELAFQNKEKEKRADELALANSELAFQNEEKEKRADELALANTELAFQNEEKQKRADELALANTELAFQNKEKEKRADELALAKTELAFQNREKEKRADELILANKELSFQKKLDVYRSEMESVAHDLTRLIDTANAPIFGIDNKGLVNEWNQSSEKITGFKKEEVLGKDLVETYITEDYRKAVKLVLDNALKGKETANYEFPLFTKDQRRVMVLLNSSTRRNAAGKIVGVLGVGQDISQMDKLRTETEAIATELRQFIETANAPIFGIDAKGKVNEWNQSSEKITGFKKEEVRGKDLVETYITEDYREAVKLVLDNALKGKETANFEFPLFTKDQRRVMVLLNSSTRRNADGEITGVLGVGQDISQMDNYKTNLEDTVKKRTFELENSLEREKELGKIKTSFVAMASHEFRTPLAAIQAATDVILRYKDKLSQEDIDKRLFKIKREVRDMTIILEDILILGKSEVQKLKFRAIELDLVVLVKNIVSDYQLTQEKPREVAYKISKDNIMLNADPKWIKHIIINLLSNALKYSEAPASIIIEIRQEKTEVILSVSDQGIGISEKDQAILFEPFNRGENVGNIQGTGLGLSILQKAIDLHKGKIKIESKLNNGSTFIVSLPYEGMG
jgi:PAS domain S-box-containing protein